MTTTAQPHRENAAQLEEKFELFIDLGVLTVPRYYDSATRLYAFHQEQLRDFPNNRLKYYTDAITDAKFPNPGRVLRPGDRLWVRVFRQRNTLYLERTSSEERMAFLVSQNAVFTGAHGATLVWEQKQGDLVDGYWYASYDTEDRLLAGPHDTRRVPVIRLDSTIEGLRLGAGFDLSDFSVDQGDSQCFFCFNELDDLRSALSNEYYASS